MRAVRRYDSGPTRPAALLDALLAVADGVLPRKPEDDAGFQIDFSLGWRPRLLVSERHKAKAEALFGAIARSERRDGPPPSLRQVERSAEIAPLDLDDAVLLLLLWSAEEADADALDYPAEPTPRHHRLLLWLDQSPDAAAPEAAAALRLASAGRSWRATAEITTRAENGAGRRSAELTAALVDRDPEREGLEAAEAGPGGASPIVLARFAERPPLFLRPSARPFEADVATATALLERIGRRAPRASGDVEIAYAAYADGDSRVALRFELPAGEAAADTPLFETRDLEIVTIASQAPRKNEFLQALSSGGQEALPGGYKLRLRPSPPAPDHDARAQLQRELDRVVEQMAILDAEEGARTRLMRFPADRVDAMARAILHLPQPAPGVDPFGGDAVQYLFSDEDVGAHYLLFDASAASHANDFGEAFHAPNPRREPIVFWEDPFWPEEADEPADRVYAPRWTYLWPPFRGLDPAALAQMLRERMRRLAATAPEAERAALIARLEDEASPLFFVFAPRPAGAAAGATDEAGWPDGLKIDVLDPADFSPLAANIPWLNKALTLSSRLDAERRAGAMARHAAIADALRDQGAFLAFEEAQSAALEGALAQSEAAVAEVYDAMRGLLDDLADELGEAGRQAADVVRSIDASLSWLDELKKAMADVNAHAARAGAARTDAERLVGEASGAQKRLAARVGEVLDGYERSRARNDKIVRSALDAIQRRLDQIRDLRK